jgi:hypothetical protein
LGVDLAPELHRYCADSLISFIRDYKHVRYVVNDAELVLAPDAAPPGRGQTTDDGILPATQIETDRVNFAALTAIPKAVNNPRHLG